MQSLLRVLEALDRFSLETRRPITLPLLRQLLSDASRI
jgi:DnaA family protein